MPGLGGMSGNPTASSIPSWLTWLKIFGIGSFGGFLFSFFADFIKKKFYRPKIEVNFPIEENTNLEDPRYTSFISFQLSSLSVSGYKVVVRAKAENKSNLFVAEKCRIFLINIKYRIDLNQEWKQTDYNELNQIAWSEKSFEFEAVDIYTETERSFDIIEISSATINVRTKQPHPSFSYLFPRPIPRKREWKLHFQVVGDNIKPSKFDLKISCAIDKDKYLKVFINDCAIDFDTLIRRSTIYECFVCAQDYFPEGINQQHSDCTCPLCGEKCVSYRPTNAGSSFRIEHDPDIKTCTPVYIIDQISLRNRTDFPKYKDFLKSHTGDSIPEIRPPQIPH